MSLAWVSQGEIKISTVESYIGKDATGRLIGQLKLQASPATVETLNYVMNAYGFLIERNESISPGVFAARIRRAYDCTDNQQNKAVVTALSVLL